MGKSDINTELIHHWLQSLTRGLAKK